MSRRHPRPATGVGGIPGSRPFFDASWIPSTSMYGPSTDEIVGNVNWAAAANSFLPTNFFEALDMAGSTDVHNSGGGGVDRGNLAPQNRSRDGNVWTTSPGTGVGLGKKNKRQVPVLTDQQIRLLEEITGRVGSDISSGQGFGLDPLAESAYGNLSRMFGPGSELGALGEEAAGKLLRGEQLIDYSDPGREQFYQEAFLNPALRDFNEDILPAISEAYAARGLERSGDVLRAMTNSGERLATSLSGQRAELLRGDQDRALLGLQSAYSAAATPQQIAFNTGQQNRFLQNPYSNPAYGIAPLALGTQPYAVRARSGSSSKGSNIGAGIGAGLGALYNFSQGGSGGSGGSSGIIWN